MSNNFNSDDIIVKYEFDYWGDNGRVFGGKLREFASVAEAVQELGNIAFHHAIDEKLVITRCIPDHTAEIADGLAQFIERKKREVAIRNHHDSIRIHKQFLETVHDKINDATAKIRVLTAEIERLEKLNGTV